MRGTEIGSQKEEGKEQRSAITDQRTQDFSGRFRATGIRYPIAQQRHSPKERARAAERMLSGSRAPSLDRVDFVVGDLAAHACGDRLLLGRRHVEDLHLVSAVLADVGAPEDDRFLLQ